MLSTKITSTYCYEHGMMNIGWVSGFARKFKAENGELTGMVQVSNDTTRMLPVKALHSDEKPPVNREPCKVTGRIYGELITWFDGEKDIEVPSAYLHPLEIGRPNILELPSDITWNSMIPGRKPGRAAEDDFKPYGNSMKDRPRDAANIVLLAGIVDSVSGILSETGNSLAGVEILLRQNGDPRRNIPVRMMNAGIARQVRKELRMGRPIYVEGKLRVRDLTRLDEDGMEVPSGVQAGYVWCRVIQNARRDRDILKVPGWISEIMDRYKIGGNHAQESEDVGLSASEAEEETQGADHATHPENPTIEAMRKRYLEDL